ncbi:hypothetical protein BIW11_01326 [Tropilaelaps mercedesae]|uniref:HTH CENPB-type domain-containing protein n=1 Tax=Tropilaelaps mercedesae TaxID=418985 RepID=A0A1V9XFJ4_9ACAR|nr:hypothetical protein BIW11_01326 [Tropilaelaps mercedesae]
MVRRYARKTCRGDYSTEQVEAAVKAVLGGLKLADAARRFAINKMSLNRYIKKLLKTHTTENEQEVSNSGKVIKIRNKTVSIGYTRTKRLLAGGEEDRLVAHLRRYAKPSSDDVRREAFLFATQLRKDVPKTWKKSGMASYDWLTSFLARRKDLSIVYKRTREQHRQGSKIGGSEDDISPVRCQFEQTHE